MTDTRQRLWNLRHLAVPKFHNEVIELTGYTLDRWDLHGVPCSCPECIADYETLRVMQLANGKRFPRKES